MRASYNFSTANYKYEIIGFEYAVQRLEDKFCKKRLGQTIQFDKVTLEGILDWTRGNAKAAVDVILKQPSKKTQNYDWAKQQIFNGVLRKYGGSEPEFRRLIIELAKRMERAEKKFKNGNVPQIIYGESD